MVIVVVVKVMNADCGGGAKHRRRGIHIDARGVRVGVRLGARG
jgi:hypothetical protein